MLSTLLSLVVLALGLMLCHKWNPFLGSVVCSVIAFYGVKKLLQGKLDSVIERFSRASAAKCRPPKDAFILPDSTMQFLSHLYGLFTGQEAPGADSQSGNTCLALLARGEDGDGERHHMSDCVTAEVKAFVDNIKSRYIDSWYSAVSSDQDFPRELEFIIEDVLRALYLRLGSLDPCDLLEQMVAVAHAHYRKYKACLTAVERTRRRSCDESCDALRREAIRKRFPMKHVAFESEASEQCYLRGITSVLVKLLEPPHLLASPATNALVIDILTNNVLVPAVDLLCEPEWLSWAVLYLVSMEEDAEVLAAKSRGDACSGATGDCLCRGEHPPLNIDAPAAAPIEGGDQSSSAVQHQRSSPALPYQGSSSSSQRSSKESGSDYLSLPDVYVGTQDNSVKIFGAKDVEKGVEAEVFLGSLVFSDICITRTESRSVPGKGVHTVYCIKYEVCKNNEVAEAPTTEVRKVWRRFREFLELQGSLESNPQLRKHLKGIRGPSRGLGSVLSDKKNVQERLVFLQHYLKQLCSREAIVNSKEFHKFLDYSEDAEEQQQPLVEMRRQASSSRLDRVLVQGVKSTLELLKTALPGDDHNILSPLSPLEGSMVLLSDYLPADLEYSFAEGNRPQQLQQCMYNFLDNFDQASSPEFSPPLTPSSLPLPQDHSPSTGSHKSSQGSPTPEVHFPPTEQDIVPLWRGNAPQTPFERVAESLHLDIPLCASAVDFMVDSLENGHACKSAQLVLFAELLLGRALERNLREQFTALFGVANCTVYLHKLHEQLWGSEARAEVFTEAQVARGLTKFVPTWAQLVFGVDNVCQAAKTLAKSIQIRDVNKCLVYQLVDILVDSLLAQDNCDARLEDNA
ncbi:sorting nexin-19-like [Amblyomma americanum]